MIYLLENWKLLRAFLCPYFFLSTFLESLVVNLFFFKSEYSKDKLFSRLIYQKNIKIKKTSQTHLMEILYKLKQKIEWVEIKNSDNCPIDLYFVSDLKIKAKNYYSINFINIYLKIHK